MYQRSDKFDKAVQDSHIMATSCNVLEDGEVIYEGLGITDGNVTVDDVAIRRRANITLTDPTGNLVPKLAEDLLFPAGNEIQLLRGIDFGDGTAPELLSLGIFGMSDVKIEDSGQGLVIQIDAFDRSRKVALNRQPEDYHIAKGTLYTEAIQNLILQAFGQLVFFSVGEGMTTPDMLVKEGDDVWEAAQKMAASIGCDLYFDVDGNCICQPQRGETDIDHVVWTYRQEQMNLAVGDEIMAEMENVKAMLMYASRRMNDEGVYNRVVVRGESTGVGIPVRGIAEDLDPASPTYIKSKFGPRSIFPTSSFVTSKEQATAYAQRQLVKEIGFYDRLETIDLVHPAHEVGDMVIVYRPLTGIGGIYVVDKITIPMVHSRGMNLSTRTRKIMVMDE